MRTERSLSKGSKGCRYWNAIKVEEGEAPRCRREYPIDVKVVVHLNSMPKDRFNKGKEIDRDLGWPFVVFTWIITLEETKINEDFLNQLVREAMSIFQGGTKLVEAKGVIDHGIVQTENTSIRSNPRDLHRIRPTTSFNLVSNANTFLDEPGYMIFEDEKTASSRYIIMPMSATSAIFTRIRVPCTRKIEESEERRLVIDRKKIISISFHGNHWSRDPGT